MSAPAGGHSESKLPTVFGWIAAAVFALIVINGAMNRYEGRDFWYGMYNPTPHNDFRGAVNPGRNFGAQTGAKNNCPAGKPVGTPYQCPTSRTGWCICR